MKMTKRVIALFAISVVSTSATCAEVPQTILLPEADEIQMALEAGPQHVRADATVYVFGKAGYRRVRTGTNGFTCLVNRDGNQNGDNDLKPTCWDAEGSRTIVPVVLRVGELLARSVSAQDIKRDIDAGFDTGRYSSPRKAGIAYMLRAEVLFDPKSRQITKTSFVPHYMVYAPGLNNTDIGMPPAGRNGRFSLPSVYSGYSGGARTAYIIVVAAPSLAHSH
ncbi:MAG TPA: hypothetical protein VK700_01155 [Steroidobacteraceae bacterium]|jgi:hypothetical protein|nr:hypothetical protein [Steroidobacteraceae bacterium]